VIGLRSVDCPCFVEDVGGDRGRPPIRGVFGAGGVGVTGGSSLGDRCVRDRDRQPSRHPEGGAPVVERVRETRQVLFRGGRWLVDIAASAG